MRCVARTSPDSEGDDEGTITSRDQFHVFHSHISCFSEAFPRQRHGAVRFAGFACENGAGAGHTRWREFCGSLFARERSLISDLILRAARGGGVTLAHMSRWRTCGLDKRRQIHDDAPGVMQDSRVGRAYRSWAKQHNVGKGRIALWSKTDSTFLDQRSQKVIVRV